MTQITAEYVNTLIAECHSASVRGGWWTDLKTSEPLKRNKGELRALVHTEIGEAYGGRKEDAYDDHLPTRAAEEVELADTIIRVCGYVGGWNLEGFTNKAPYAASKPKPLAWTTLLTLETGNEDRAYHRFRLYVDDTIEHARKSLSVGEEEALSILFVEIHDWCEANGYDLRAAITDKLAYNANRADHKIENRKKDEGKVFLSVDALKTPL